MLKIIYYLRLILIIIQAMSFKVVRLLEIQFLRIVFQLSIVISEV